MSGKKKEIEPIDITKVRQNSYFKRTNKTETKAFAKPISGKNAKSFFDSLPDFLKASDLNTFIDHIVKARKKNLPFHLMLGAHTIKVGLSPIINDLMKRDIVTGLSFNCAGLIHDLELAFWGGTSEDVLAGLSDGSFGMSKETSEHFTNVVNLADKKQIGLGKAGGEYINLCKAKNASLSVFAVAHKKKLPVTIHVGIGTDIVAQHPDFDSGKTAEASYIDFKILASICEDLDRGGVIANIGSAVILPEVFLKALTVARNISNSKNKSNPQSKLTTADFDMISHYRPMVNVVSRPTHNSGQGYSFIGHHEIMLPLLAWGIKARITK